MASGRSLDRLAVRTSLSLTRALRFLLGLVEHGLHLGLFLALLLALLLSGKCGSLRRRRVLRDISLVGRYVVDLLASFIKSCEFSDLLADRLDGAGRCVVLLTVEEVVETCNVAYKCLRDNAG